MTLSFVRPLVGFEEHQEYDLEPYADLPPFVRLASRLDPEVSFSALDPALVRPDYRALIESSVNSELKLEPGERWQAYCLVTTAEGALALNLAAPVVVLEGREQAAQLVLADTSLAPCHPLGAAV